MMLLPTFLGIGSPKCGTTWLYHCLSEHPDVFLPEKEIHFFSTTGDDVFKSRGVEWYASFFKNALLSQARGDISPLYMQDQRAPARIKQILPNCKMLILLRDPVARAYSHYWMMVGRGQVDYTFEDLIENPKIDRHQFLTMGLYARQIEHYLEFFSQDNFLTILADDIKTNPELVLYKIFEFIDVNSSFKPNLTHSKMNQAHYLRNQKLFSLNYKFARFMALNNLNRVRRLIKRTGLPQLLRRYNRARQQYPPLTKEHRAALIDYYRQDVQLLSQLLGRNIDHWLQV